jgi:two-component system nitrate/nitrite sensor histidine kinase NarX
MDTVVKDRPASGAPVVPASSGTWLRCLLLPPAGESGGGFLRSPICRPLGALALVGAAWLGSALLILVYPGVRAWLLGIQVLCLILAVSLSVVLYRRIDRQLLTPLTQLRSWAQAMRRGELNARIAQPEGGEFHLLAKDINALSEELRRLSVQMDREVAKHTEMLAQKTRSLQVLYDVAASINIFNNLEDLLTRFLHTLIDVLGAQAAAVRLLNEEGQMKLVASVGLSDEEQARGRVIPADRSVWGTVVAEGEDPVDEAGQAWSLSPLQDVRLETISVPLRYHGKTLGVYNLFVDRSDLSGKDDIRNLLTSMGRHLGMAIEKVRVDLQAQRLSIMQERNALAHELHDSLAQTLASLRFQVRMLEDTLDGDKLDEARQEVADIRTGLDEANTELRGLLAHYRAPMDKRGLLPALEDTVARFRRETGIVTFFQKECSQANLPANVEIQVLRIAQEALANIRKHSQAHAVRILLRCESQGHYHFMVEDDGIGMAQEVQQGKPGEHLGLAIIRERAARLGAELTIESEQAEGTRIELSFQYPRPADGG